MSGGTAPGGGVPQPTPQQLEYLQRAQMEYMNRMRWAQAMQAQMARSPYPFPMMGFPGMGGMPGMGAPDGGLGQAYATGFFGGQKGKKGKGKGFKGGFKGGYDGDKGKGKGKGKFKGKDFDGRPVPPVVSACPEDQLARHCEIKGAHAGPIMAIAMTPDGIFTGSTDRSVKRWKPVKGADGAFQLVPELSVPLNDSCHSLLLQGTWIFCGLWSGDIEAFSQDGAKATLTGHTRCVRSLLMHQNVLISGGGDREVRLWQMDPATKTFTCTHTLSDSMPGSITKLHVLGETLIVGGTNGIAMVNLTNLTVTKLLPPTKAVADMLEYQGHIIVGYQEGGLRVFDAQGELKSEMKPLAAGPLVSLAGLEAGPRVLCGHARGQVSSIELPSFAFRVQFQALAGHKVENVFCAGHDGIFLIGAADGSLQMWQRLAPA